MRDLENEEALEPVTQPLLHAIDPAYIDGLDSVYVEYYNRYKVGRLDSHDLTVEEAKHNAEKYSISFGLTNGPEIKEIQDVKCPVKDGQEIGIRVFQPNHRSSPDDLVPAYINYHGGGWTFGDISSDNSFCRKVCYALDCVVFNVDYRTAPEYRFPTQIEDSWSALTWIYHNCKRFGVDSQRVAIGGVSAGAHLTAVMAQKCRDAGIKLCLQILAVPSLDNATLSRDYEKLENTTDYPSWVINSRVPVLPIESMRWYYRSCLGPERKPELDHSIILSPIKNPNLKGLAPALIITAEYDILRDEGVRYAEKLTENGVQVLHKNFEHEVHSFMVHDGVLESAREYNKLTISCLEKSFQGASIC